MKRSFILWLTLMSFAFNVFEMLEPQSNDGLVVWNYFDRYLVPQWGTGYNPFPVYKILNNTEIKTKLIM